MNTEKTNRPHWMRIGSAVIILILGAGIMFILAATKEEAKKKEATQRVRKVALTPLVFEDHTLQIHGNGSIESQHTLNLVSMVAGEVIYAREDLKSGSFVRQGEVLLRIDDREAQNRTLQARSGLINAIVSLIPELKGNADTETYEKWNQYLKSLSMSTTPQLPAIADPQERIRVSMHNIFNQHAVVKNAEITLERHTLRAPFDAYLMEDGVLQGSWISPGQIAVALIDPFHLEISVPLALSELKLLKEEGAPLAHVFPTEDHSKFRKGILDRQNAHIDKRSQTVTLHVELENPDLDPAFLPGNYMDVFIQGVDFKNVAKLPRDVIAPGPFIYTLEDSTLGKHAVEILATEGDSVLVSRGDLKNGLQVVTTLIQNPIVGMRIAPFEDDTDTSLSTI